MDYSWTWGSFFFVWRSVLSKRGFEEKKAEALKAWVEKGTIASTDTLIDNKSNGTSILVVRNCIFKEFENSFAAGRNDSTGLVYFTKRIIYNPDYQSITKQWEQITDDNKYEYSNLRKDSTDNLVKETSDFVLKYPENRDGKGRIILTKKGGLIYALQIMSYTSRWDQLSPEIERIETSFRIRE
ncbi:hypothetical protein BH10BAC4_BH10BAC4_18970 [soil metagenome]